MPRDWSKPYTEEELEKLKTIFRGLSTYRIDGDSINSSDIPALIQAMEFPRTPEQVKAYQDYWETQCGGIISMDAFVTSASSVHSSAEFAKDYALKFDTDGTGFIPPGAFQALMNVMVKHDSKLESKTYEEFLKEADLDLDGKVSIDECNKWIDSNFNKV